MANSFNKEERVAFEELLSGFNDALVLSKNVSIYNTNQTQMARSGDVIWRPVPYMPSSFATTPGVSIASLYQDMVQLAVPASISKTQTVPWTLNARELSDGLREQTMYKNAKLKLASDINRDILQEASLFGTLVVPIAGASGDFDDIAQCDSMMSETGVMDSDRYLALSTRDYNGLAANLAQASRSFGNQKSDLAYERSYVGNVAGFETFKLDYAPRLAGAAGGSITINTGVAANNYYVPKSITTTAIGKINVDNRTQVVTVVGGTANIKAGDAFVLDGVNAIHHITKQDTGRRKSFRVISVVSSNQLQISPPIISAQGGSAAEVQYQNCLVVSPSTAAPFIWLNDNSTYQNVFWHKDALEILPGRYSYDTDSGVSVLRATTDQGIEVAMLKQGDIDRNLTKYRVEVFYGVVNKQPEMTGVLLFNQ